MSTEELIEAEVDFWRECLQDWLALCVERKRGGDRNNAPRIREQLDRLPHDLAMRQTWADQCGGWARGTAAFREIVLRRAEGIQGEPGHPLNSDPTWLEAIKNARQTDRRKRGQGQ